MKPFLKEVTKTIYSKYQNNFDDIAIIFPNKRARLYFNKYLSEIIDKPIFSPEIFTISELITKFSQLRVDDELTLTFKLFLVYKEHLKSTENFDDFYYWGQMLLSDFNDIDNNIVDAEKIFTHISDIKEIENIFDYLTDEQKESIKTFWKSFDIEKTSKQQTEFLDIWKKLFAIYQDFNKKLSSENLAYQGMIYKDALSNFNIDFYNKNIKYHKLIFVGFNALNKTEKELFGFLNKEKIAEFYWDYDEYYKQNPIHEANYFLKDNLKNFYTPNNLDYNNLQKDKNIEIISTPTNVGQAKLISNFIDEFKKDKDFDIDKTTIAIVLADETLLIPVLNSIPEYINDVNITMGFPISESPAFSLFNSLIDLQQSQKKGDVFYYKSIRKVIEHPYISSLYADDAYSIVNYILEHNKIYIGSESLIKNDLYKLIFKNISEKDSISDYINNIIYFISEELKESENPNHEVVTEHLQTIFLTVKKFDDILNNSDIEIKTKTYLSILKTIIKNKTIPYTGEPLKGLQIMGILETRTLDFDNLIFLSLNEGVLPKTASSASFVPYSLRRGFGMPTIEHQDAVFGYYFYRLIQRSKNIKLVYNSAISTTSKEKSRFLTQIMLEDFTKYKLNDLSFNVNISTNKNIVIEKNEEIQSLLKRYLKHEIKLSPSALNTYLNCSLMFYFRYIASIKESDKVSEDIDPMQFGSIFHLAMETLYADFKINKTTINQKHLLSILNSKETISNAVLKGFTDIVFKTDSPISIDQLHGKNIIIYYVIIDYITKLIEQDIKQVPFKIVDLEGKYYLPIDIVVNDKTESIITGGSIDRIDEKDNFFKILDYKTGNASAEFTSIEELFDIEKEKRPKEVLQTFIYTIAYMHSENIDKAIPGIIQILKIYNKDYSTDINYIEKRKKYKITDFSIYKNEFIKHLSTEISKIFDSNIPFSQTEHLKHCEYCSYKNICHK